ncbi:MAG TPA: helix-turn-helix domain-containing protein [Anaerolineales bacterium]|nr:helix-turn-helix domain-containing protein [Anaerolineales bacterium]
MLKVGEFSRLSQVTIKTLHHYDELGLIKPAHIDPITNYRFYTLEQLPRIHRIMALKEMGLSLEQIGLMLDQALSTEQMRGMLHLKQAEIQQEMREAQRQLAMVEFRLRMIEAEINFPELDVVIKKLEAMRFLSFFAVSHATMEKALTYRAIVVSTLQKAIADGVIQHTGVVIDVFHGETIIPFTSPEIKDRQHEILLGVKNSQEAVKLKGIGQLTVKEEPTVETAATLMLESSDLMDINLAGYVEKATLLRRWAIAHGFRPQDLVRYLSHRGILDSTNPAEYVIEAQLPVDQGD